MFYAVTVKDHIRVPPELFEESRESALIKCIKKKYDGFISKDMGFVISVSKVNEVNDGVVVPGDGAVFYETSFDLLTFKPELHEVLYGKVRDITDFGAFLSIGPTEGMVHVSQTMDDFVSFAKDKVLQGRDSGKSLRIGDDCLARVIAISYKDLTNPRIGLTMRQPTLGKLEWFRGENKK